MNLLLLLSQGLCLAPGDIGVWEKEPAPKLVEMRELLQWEGTNEELRSVPVVTLTPPWWLAAV